MIITDYSVWSTLTLYNQYHDQHCDYDQNYHWLLFTIIIMISVRSIIMINIDIVYNNYHDQRQDYDQNYHWSLVMINIDVIIIIKMIIDHSVFSKLLLITQYDQHWDCLQSSSWSVSWLWSKLSLITQYDQLSLITQ